MNLFGMHSILAESLFVEGITVGLFAGAHDHWRFVNLINMHSILAESLFVEEITVGLFAGAHDPLRSVV